MSSLTNKFASLLEREEALLLKENALLVAGFESASAALKATQMLNRKKKHGNSHPPPEVKGFYAGIVPTAATVAGSMITFSDIPQGVTRSSRVGDEAWPKTVSFKYTVAASTGGLFVGADSYDSVRLIFFQWHMDNTSFPPTAAILLNPGLSNNVINPLNIDTAHLYTVLYDKTHVLFNTPVYNGTAVAVEAGPNHAYTTPDHIVLKNMLPISFEANGITGVNTIYLYICSDSAFTPSPTVTLASAMRYIDA